MTLRRLASFAVCGAATLLGAAAISAAPQDKTTWSGIYTDAQATRGAAMYKEKCARCHADELTGNDAPALVGGEFLGNWNGLTVNDLFERIRVSMPDDAKGTLTRPEVADGVALILQKNGMPAGETELPTDGAALSAIKFASTKPAQ